MNMIFFFGKKKNLFNVFTPREIDLPMKGSIWQIQMNVTQTWLGHGKQPTMDPILNVDSCCLQPGKQHCTGLLYKKQRCGRSRVRFEKRSRIFCPHCCTKTLLLDPMDIMCCHTCHALLPLLLFHGPCGTQDHLLGRVVNVWSASVQFHAPLVG